MANIGPDGTSQDATGPNGMSQDAPGQDTPGPASLVRTVDRDLADCPKGPREIFGRFPGDRSLHTDCLRNLPLFRMVEHGLEPSRTDKPERLRIGAWNLERCAHASRSAALLARSHVDVALLTEMDVGMARTGQIHTPREIAQTLGHTCIYGVEFLELSLGSAREEGLFAGQTNDRGFHGNALTAAYPLQDPVLIRFDERPTWFPVDCDERRIGSRMAVAGRLAMAGGDLVIVCAHLEIRVSAEDRAAQTRALLQAVSDYAGEDPVIVGGDFNTDSDVWSLGKQGKADPARIEALKARTLEPERHEPLFQVFSDQGYGWQEANKPGRTTRATPQSGPRRYPDLRLDWFFTKGVNCSGPDTVPAVDLDGNGSEIALSDHDLIVVDITL